MSAKVSVIKELLKRPIAYHGILAKAIRSVPAAVMVSQGLYWQGKAEDSGAAWFYVTAEDWYDQTGVTKEAQLTARKHLAKLGFWEERLFGMPARMHFQIDIDALVAVINQYLETGKPVAGDYRNKLREKPRTSSGKFRQQAAVNYRNKKNKEIKESNEREHAHAQNVSSTLDAAIPPPPNIAPAPPAPWKAIDCTHEIELMRNDEACAFRFVRDTSLPQAEYPAALDAFLLKAQTEAKVYNNRTDIRSHFFNWASGPYKKMKNERPKFSFGPDSARRAIESAERLAREIESGNY